jgi:hypothetical protein
VAAIQITVQYLLNTELTADQRNALAQTKEWSFRRFPSSYPLPLSYHMCLGSDRLVSMKRARVKASKVEQKERGSREQMEEKGQCVRVFLRLPFLDVCYYSDDVCARHVTGEWLPVSAIKEVNESHVEPQLTRLLIKQSAGGSPLSLDDAILFRSLCIAKIFAKGLSVPSWHTPTLFVTSTAHIFLLAICSYNTGKVCRRMIYSSLTMEDWRDAKRDPEGRKYVCCHLMLSFLSTDWR